MLNYVFFPFLWQCFWSLLGKNQQEENYKKQSYSTSMINPQSLPWNSATFWYTGYFKNHNNWSENCFPFPSRAPFLPSFPKQPIQVRWGLPIYNMPLTLAPSSWWITSQNPACQLEASCFLSKSICSTVLSHYLIQNGRKTNSVGRNLGLCSFFLAVSNTVEILCWHYTVLLADSPEHFD